MNMGDRKEPDEEWGVLGRAWQEQDGRLALTEDELEARLRRRRMMLAVLGIAEAASLLLALAAVAYLSRAWLETPGASPIMIIWLLLCIGFLLWRRVRQRAAVDRSVLEGIDASTERDERLLESVRLGGVMGMIALGGLIIAAVMSPGRRGAVLTPAGMCVLGALSVYVFGLQIVLLVWGRRVLRRRRQREAIQRALHPPHRS